MVYDIWYMVIYIKCILNASYTLSTLYSITSNRALFTYSYIHAHNSLVECCWETGVIGNWFKLLFYNQIEHKYFYSNFLK